MKLKLALVCAAALAAPLAAHGQAGAVKTPDPKARAQALVAKMTPDEKIAIVHGHFPPLTPHRPANVQISAGWVPGVPRLGIPDLYESDASLGVANARRGAADDAAALPSGALIAATFDPEIAYAGGAMIGKETRRKGFNVLLSGGANLVRDPRNGRNFEYVSEDVLLTGVMAGAAIRGVQSAHVVSTLKHYALNAQETGRSVLNAVIDPAAFRESDLLAFEIAHEQGRPASVMCSYNHVNGPYACENAPLFAVLKGDWGFQGWVMSDWGAVHSVASANAGLDQQSGQELDKQVFFDAPLRAAVASGEVPAARLDEMATRILTGVAQVGLLDDPVKAGGLDTAADTAVAQRAAEAGITLLRNEGGALPLLASAKRIAVIGGHADIGVLSGGGSSQVIPKGSTKFPAPKWAPTWGEGQIYHPSSPLAALRARAGSGAQVSFDAGTDPAAAAAAAKGADVAIVFATQWATEGADVSTTLPDGQDAVISAVAAANPHTIVVLETGGAVLMPWFDKTAAVVEAWYPGQKGGEALARVLYGDVDVQGRLPVSFAQSDAQLPRPQLPGADTQPVEGVGGKPGPAFDVNYPEGADVGYRWFEAKGLKAQLPFGYGLSYTRFAYRGLKVEGGRALKVSFEVTNTGKRPGVDTPQVYASAPGRTRRLVGWRKVALKPGETKTVSVTADPRLLARFDVGAHGWRLAAGDYAVSVGRFAGDAAMSGHVALAAQSLKP